MPSLFEALPPVVFSPSVPFSAYSSPTQVLKDALSTTQASSESVFASLYHYVTQADRLKNQPESLPDVFYLLPYESPYAPQNYQGYKNHLSLRSEHHPQTQQRSLPPELALLHPSDVVLSLDPIYF